VVASCPSYTCGTLLKRLAYAVSIEGFLYLLLAQEENGEMSWRWQVDDVYELLVYCLSLHRSEISYRNCSPG
jgi:hypothetical protein